ncbi:MAG: hypothetical protein IAE94_01345 [Chthoniobacterales bacterium]|nr:hypothetical protein [Chthoniobacterales bacterium]
MSAHDLLKDPFYAQLMFVIESCICKADHNAAEMGVRLTDSNIKSALNKARKLTTNLVIEPKPNIANREDVIAELAASIAANRKLLEVEGEDNQIRDISNEDWMKAIAAVSASLKVRMSGEPGGRYYLDYVREFIERQKV